MLKTEVVTVGEWGGRDRGKIFKLTEMPARRAEKWAWRLFLAVKGTGAQVPESLAQFGMVAVAIRGINSFLASDVDFAKLEPLLDEMIDECVGLVRDINAVDPVNGGPLGSPMFADADIEEVPTIAWLRSEVLRLHTGFSVVEALLTWVSTLPKEPPDSSNT